MTKIDKFFGDKKSSSVIYILLAMGILLLICGSVLKPQPQQPQEVYTDSRAAEAERILSEIKGVGNVRVMISGEEKEKSAFLSDEDNSLSEGVLIVADGGGDSRVREKIIRAAGAALGVDPHKIQVFERKE